MNGAFFNSKIFARRSCKQKAWFTCSFSLALSWPLCELRCLYSGKSWYWYPCQVKRNPFLPFLVLPFACMQLKGCGYKTRIAFTVLKTFEQACPPFSPPRLNTDHLSTRTELRHLILRVTAGQFPHVSLLSWPDPPLSYPHYPSVFVSSEGVTVMIKDQVWPTSWVCGKSYDFN